MSGSRRGREVRLDRTGSDRIATRDPMNQIPLDLASIRQVHTLSVAAEVKAAFSLENRALTEAEIVSRFQAALGAEHGGFERR